MKKLIVTAKANGQEHETTQTVPAGAEHAAMLMAVSNMINTLQAAQFSIEELHVTFSATEPNT
ncbi:hypothetical protein I6F35_33630 [Bradyrhizobium sp. BRP22]|uniref:hypothetical protein n=1 Tax=Bradyrhizobium sp. BRP22 TaxID=2793821 RepID=UPI001CD3C8D5|nr:hypothetical protein [Bradyrhizobium sp. BRP22]MCA1458077.1 hypothetical protein [Bradyrhizobium sp. BRP22]